MDLLTLTDMLARKNKVELLQQLLRENGLSTKGNKDDLIERLRESSNQTNDNQQHEHFLNDGINENDDFDNTVIENENYIPLSSKPLQRETQNDEREKNERADNVTISSLRVRATRQTAPGCGFPNETPLSMNVVPRNMLQLAAVFALHRPLKHMENQTLNI